jgi:TonB family protein
MSAVASSAFNQTFRRAFPRRPINVPVDLIALRCGVPESVPGRCTDISESGLGAVIAGELSPGQQVAIELRLPHVGMPVRARALVRYQSQLHCGLELVGLSRDQQDMIRYWLHQPARNPALSKISSREQKNEAEIEPATDMVAASALSTKVTTEATEDAETRAEVNLPSRQTIRLGHRATYSVAVLILVLTAFGWWQWQKSWRELETQTQDAKGGLHVSAETMGTRIVTKVDPIYPEVARRLGTQGLVVLDAVIASDGSVKKLRPVSGPDVLVQSATAAVGSWKFEPYLSSGKPVEVETTIAVEFRLD